ncbi:hypothetical protein Pcinc_036612, partial [Petrolisthes cinctipes]
DIVREDYNYDYDDDGLGEYDDDYTPTDILPTFIATPQEFNVEVGGDITFPCDVQDQGKHVLMFKHILPNGVNRLLFVGEVNVKKFKKLDKVGTSFVLRDVRKHHAGQYACRIETIPITQITHTLNVQYPAAVELISPKVQHVVQGSSVTLECGADGNPPAAISWSRQQGHLPSGYQSEEGTSITFENVDRHIEGTYICTASNGIGTSSSASMTLEVKYPPEIITEQAILHTGEGNEAKLMCAVRGRPTPTVSWTKDNQPLDSSSRHILQHDTLHRHTLTIAKVVEEDFGEYTCTANNGLGRTQRTLMLTGLPKTPTMTSSPSGGEENTYTLTWHTESNTPIIQYRLQYRKFMGNTTGRPQMNWNVRLFSTNPSTRSTTTTNTNTNTNTNTHPHHPHHHHNMTHAIGNLEAATDYEAKVAVENKFGWSEDSPVFHFYTRKEVAIGRQSSYAGILVMVGE